MVHALKSLEKIQAAIDRLAEQIGAADHRSLPSYGRTADFALPHVEVDSRGYHYVIVERGQEQSRFTTRDFDGLLEQVFDGVTSELAVEHELRHRIEGLDCRRLIFKHKLDLLSKLSADWAAHAEAKQAGILRMHPFDDEGADRAEMTRKLRESGHSPEVAWKMAAERYPLPDSKHQGMKK